MMMKPFTFCCCFFFVLLSFGAAVGTSSPTSDSDDLTHLGLDGIERHYSASGQVLSARAIPQSQYLGYIARDAPPEQRSSLVAAYKTYGHRVTKRQMLYPPPMLRPRVFFDVGSSEEEEGVDEREGLVDRDGAEFVVGARETAEGGGWDEDGLVIGSRGFEKVEREEEEEEEGMSEHRGRAVLKKLQGRKKTYSWCQHAGMDCKLNRDCKAVACTTCVHRWLHIHGYCNIKYDW